MNLDDDINRRYSDMLKRCNVRLDEDEDDEEEETTEDSLYLGDLNVWDSKPELIGKGVKFERLRRVTGYLSGRGIDGMNNAKQAEVRDRVIHG